MTMVLKQTLWKSPLPNLAPHSSTGCIIPWAVPPPTLDENIISQKALLFLILYNTVQNIFCIIQYSIHHKLQYSRVSSLPGASFADTKIPAPGRWYSTLLYCTALHCIVMYKTVLYCFVLYCTVQHYSALHRTALQRTVRPYTAL